MKPSQAKNSNGRMGRIAVVVIVLLVVAAIYFGVRGGEDVGGQSGTTFTAAQGDLEITVLEGGSVEAAQSVEIKSEVQGQTKILSIVDEGYQITDQNVADGMILVELDAKALMDELTERELNYQNALASYTEAKEQYGIQVSQNQSDISKAEMDVRFAKLDLEKFLGGSLANDIIADLGLDISNIPEAAGEEEPVEEALVADEGLMSLSMDSIANMGTIGVRGYIERGIDFTELADPGKLGDGEARQQLRTHEDDRVLAEEEMGIAKSRLDGTKQLFQKEFVTQIELENDELALRRREIAKDAAEVSRELYVKYEFPKQAEQLLSSYEEALRGLERARKLAISKLAQAEASLNSAEARFNLQERKRDEVAEQIEKCVIRAPQPGMVVYGGSERSWRDDDRIEEGAQIRERQVIITIPNTNVMSVEVKVHESFVQRVEAGQPARIRVDAFPEKSLTGEVSKIAVLPDSQNRWLNPDLKVYATTVTINGNHDWLKPGMSAEAEIVVEQLQEVTYVPLQAVTPEKDEQVCYVQTALGAQRRVVETGQYNDSFIQITDGIEPGDVVLLRVPDEAREDGGGAPGGDGEGASGAQAV